MDSGVVALAATDNSSSILPIVNMSADKNKCALQGDCKNNKDYNGLSPSPGKVLTSSFSCCQGPENKRRRQSSSGPTMTSQTPGTSKSCCTTTDTTLSPLASTTIDNNTFETNQGDCSDSNNNENLEPSAPTLLKDDVPDEYIQPSSVCQQTPGTSKSFYANNNLIDKPLSSSRQEFSVSAEKVSGCTVSSSASTIGPLQNNNKNNKKLSQSPFVTVNQRLNSISISKYMGRLGITGDSLSNGCKKAIGNFGNLVTEKSAQVNKLDPATTSGNVVQVKGNKTTTSAKPTVGKNISKPAGSSSAKKAVPTKLKPTTAKGSVKKPAVKKPVLAAPPTVSIPAPPTVSIPAPPPPAPIPFPPPQTQLSSYIITSNPPTPPNWSHDFHTANQAVSTYTKISINPNSIEYKVLEKLISPSKININLNAINRIINPTLWNRFCSTRKELMCNKSDDLKLLADFGLNEQEIGRRDKINKNSPKNSAIGSAYSDNVALLFHGSRGSVDSILSQGLDDRLSNAGSLGRGIYFADNAQVSVGYDQNRVLFICAVYLGDCLCTNYAPLNLSYGNATSYLTREPQKLVQQQRNSTDYFFDSIVRSAGFNQYVIFNRCQCVPLYTVEYSYANAKGYSGVYSSNYQQPPFAWTSQSPWHATATTVNPKYSNYAQNIFQKMGSAIVIDTQSPSALSPTEIVQVGVPDLVIEEEEEVKSAEENKLEIEDSKTAAPDKEKEPEATTTTNEVLPPPVPKTEECTICSNEYEVESDNWKTLSCNHKLCMSCHTKLQTTKTTMSGTSHTFLKCPFCQTCSDDGIEIGSCPNGTMNVTLMYGTSLPGHNEISSVIRIQYNVPPNARGLYEVYRIAYLPNSTEGQQVLDLLRVAWDRRLIFSIGTSMTTGAEDVLVWNIHHKTSLSGGVQCYGYPDPTYLSRVKLELAEYGIQ